MNHWYSPTSLINTGVVSVTIVVFAFLVAQALCVNATSLQASPLHLPIVENRVQDSSTNQQIRAFQTKPTRKQILAMKFEDLSALSLEELTALSTIVGVSSVDELLKLLVSTASKSNETVNDAPGIVSVITAREIELFGAQTLADVLNYVVAVQLYSSSSFQSNFTLRGDLIRRNE
jgi:TonB-dependent Receptor Plug Domain